MTYKLVKNIVAEHEHNIGPFPSGYAYLRIKLEPILNKDEVCIITPADSIWKIRSTKDSENIDPDRLKGLIDLYKVMIMKGVSEGVRKGLADSLDHPVISVTVSIEEVVFDTMYSTEAAFYYVALDLVKGMLIEAHKNSSLILDN